MRIEYNPNIRTIDDSVEKFLAPAAMAAGKVLAAPVVGAAKVASNAIGAVAGKVAGKLGIGQKNQPDPALTAAEQNVKQKEQELATAQQELETLQGQGEQQAVEEPPAEAPAMPAEATAGKAIGGMDGNEGGGAPTEQPGTDVTAPPTAETPVTKSYFIDNFGISGGELIGLLQKGGEETVLDSVIHLLHQEQRAVLKQFDWWEDSDWNLLELKDNDFNLVSMFPDRLELPLRQTIVGVKKAKGEQERSEIWKGWHSRLDAENRLSRRERGILTECHNTLLKHGAMNSQTISSYGVKASSSEIGSLIKSYGYLFDVTVVGKGTKHDDRTLYYGTPKPPIFLKTVDSFVGNLWEVEGSLELTPTGAPRLTLPFNTKRGADYTVVLKQRLGVEGISWEGNKFVIEGSKSFQKAAIQALPYLTEKRENASLYLSALDGNVHAERILQYRHNPDLQVELLKEWNVAEEKIDTWVEAIVNG